MQIMTTCPPPAFGTPGCFQTTVAPRPEQDCCNSIPLCQPLTEIPNASVVPPGGTGTFPGCVSQELPTCCLSSNERGTIWYRFKIRPLPNGPKTAGSPAGYLRFRIIPTTLFENYDPLGDDGTNSETSLDYDFALFNTTNACDNADACTKIKASTNFGTAGSIIVSCNYSGLQGATGLTSAGTDANQTAAGDRFNKQLKVRVGEVYTLAVDNFSVDQEGYWIDFRALEDNDDSTAVVTPTEIPEGIVLKSVTNPVCNEKEITLTFSSPIRTDSVAASNFEVIGQNAPYTLTPVGSGSNCFGVEDTTFTFSIQPNVPDTTLFLVIRDEIKDICGNVVRLDTIPFRIPFPKPFKFGITGNQPSCGISKMNVQFAKPVLCDSVKPAKFNIWQNGSPLGQIIKIERANGLPCTGKTQDTLFTLTLSQAVVDTSTLRLVLSGIIKDSCQNEVTFDTLKFSINPFLKIMGIRDTVCPDSTIKLRTQLDSTFKTYVNSAAFKLKYTWKDLSTMDTLTESLATGVNFTGTLPNNPLSEVEIKKDSLYAQRITYRVYVLNTDNGCVDSADVQTLFSPRPRIVDFATPSLCYGQVLNLKPQMVNAALDQLEYKWTRTGTPSMVVSRDSLLVRTVVDSLLDYGQKQNFKLDVNFKKQYGGCVGSPEEFSAVFGKRISPLIKLVPEEPLASIIPADFFFDNKTEFYPAKAKPFFKWNFGDETTKDVYGYEQVTNRYNISGKYTITVTGYDTLYTNPNTIGVVCSNSDSVEIEVQNLVPSLVTANGDNLNDLFEIQGMRPNTFSAKIYNRWGKKILDQDPYDNKFDPGSNLEPGTYYYILTEKRSSKNQVGWFQVNRQ